MFRMRRIKVIYSLAQLMGESQRGIQSLLSLAPEEGQGLHCARRWPMTERRWHMGGAGPRSIRDVWTEGTEVVQRLMHYGKDRRLSPGLVQL